MKRGWDNMLPKSNIHTHSTFSDGKNPPEDMVRAALALGFHTLGFGKYDSLGLDNAMAGLSALPEKRLEELQKKTIHG